MFCALAFSEVKAQSVPFTLTADSVHQPIKTTLTEWGVGGVSLLDTYLSPLTYKGTDFAFDYHTERLAHWGKRHVTVRVVSMADIMPMHNRPPMTVNTLMPNLASQEGGIIIGDPLPIGAWQQVD